MKNSRVLKTPRARLDLVHCYAYLGERSPEAARRFRLSAEKTFAALSGSPGTGELYEVENPLLEGLRCSPVGHFRNYLIFYRPIEGGIDVIRVLHAARNIQSILDEEGS